MFFFFGYIGNFELSRIGDVMAGVLAIRPKVHGFKPCRGQCTFKSDENP
jgi:hypothetical protein